MTCPACEDARTNPDTGIVHADGRGCAVRSVSNAPEWAQEAYYAKIRDDARRAAFVADVKAEIERRKALRSNR